MATYLKQSTAHTLRIGPFLDETDGKTTEESLTITQPDIRFSKAGGDFIQHNAAATLSHDEAGWYILILDTTDTNTVGSLIIAIHESGALPVWREFQVLEEAIYDDLFGTGAALAKAAALATLDTTVGMAGAGLTDLGGMSTGMKGEVESEANDALVGQKLDHLVAAADGDDPVNGSIIAHMVSTTEDWSTFVPSTDSLQAVRDHATTIKSTVDNNESGIGIIVQDTAAMQPLIDTLSNAFVLTSAVIETVTSQTAFVLPATADAVDDDAYIGAVAVFIDGSDPNQKSIREVTGYTASSRTVTLDRAPDFTITTADTITLLASATAATVWDARLTGSTYNLSTSAGKRLRQAEEAVTLASGTIAAVSGHTATLDAGAVATADYYIGARLQIVEGNGAGQSRIIVAYTSGKVATLDSEFTTAPNTASLYEVVAADVHVSVSDTDLAGGFVNTYTNTTTITLDGAAVATTDYYNGMIIVFTHGVGAGQSREITDYTSGRVVTMSPALITALDATTVWHIQATNAIPEIVDEVWAKSMTELAAVPGVTGTVLAALEWVFLMSRNKMTQTATTTTLRNDVDDGDIATSTVSDDSTTFTRGEYS